MECLFWWILSVCFVHTVVASHCSKDSRVQNLTGCLEKIREGLSDPHKYWFGYNYTARCPLNEASGTFCENPRPGAHSIHERLFNDVNYTMALDRFLELKFESAGKDYVACGNTFKTTETWAFDVDPVSDTVVYPWYVKDFPVFTNWTSSTEEYYTFIVYDAGSLESLGIHINIVGNDGRSGEVIKYYKGPIIATDILNPLVFLLFKQSGVVLPDTWMTNTTSENLLSDIANSANISDLVAINWITVTGDEWSAQYMMDNGGPYAMCPLFVTKAFHRNQREFIPADTQLSVLLDYTFLSLVDHTITVCCTEHKYRARNFSLNPLGDQSYSSWELRSGIPHYVTFLRQGEYSQRKNFTDDLYTILAVDPDSSVPSAGTDDRPILYGLAVNVKIVEGNIVAGERVVPWIGPNVTDDGLHYYYTLLYKQQYELNGTGLNAQYTGETCSSALSGRCLFDLNSIVSDKTLELVGATWFTARKDAYVLERQLNETGSSEPEVCRGQPGYSIPCVTGTATSVFPSLLYPSVLLQISLLVFG